MVKANGEGLDAANLAPDNLEVFPEESGIVTEVQAKSTGRIDDNVGNQTTSFGPWMLVSKNQCKGARPKQGSGPGPKVQVQLDSRFNLLGNEEPKDQITPDLGNIASTHTPKHFEGKEEKLKLSSQEGRSKKTQTGKTPSILKSNVFAVQSKEVSKMQMERKEAGRQSFEAVAQFDSRGDKLGLEGLPYVETYLPSKEDIRATNKVNRNMGDMDTASNPPNPGAMVDAHSPVVFVSVSPMVEQASAGMGMDDPTPL
ncbi:hypothetical protein AHAS_Ahas15G0389400 [Arachis hypogaea]